MADITRYPFLRSLRADVSSHIQHFRNGKLRRQGRGLNFLFEPGGASIVEIPMDDRELPVFFNAKTADYQDLAVQGTLIWRVVDPAQLGARIDMTLDLQTGRYTGEPLEQIRNVVAALAQQFGNAHLRGRGIRDALEAGPAPLQAQILASFAADPTLAGLGLELVNAVIATLTPSKELARALQTPTFEALQQEADEAMFARRATAVEKEQAIAENELATQIELATRQKALIEREEDNGRLRAKAKAEAARMEAETRADTTRLLATAEADGERERLAVLGTLDPQLIMALAAREFATKLDTVESLTVTPDMLTQLAQRFAPAEAA